MLTVHVVNKKLNMFRFFKQDENVINVSLIKTGLKLLGQSLNTSFRDDIKIHWPMLAPMGTPSPHHLSGYRIPYQIK